VAGNNVTLNLFLAGNDTIGVCDPHFGTCSYLANQGQAVVNVSPGALSRFCFPGLRTYQSAGQAQDGAGDFVVLAADAWCNQVTSYNGTATIGANDPHYNHNSATPNPSGTPVTFAAGFTSGQFTEAPSLEYLFGGSGQGLYAFTATDPNGLGTGVALTGNSDPIYVACPCQKPATPASTSAPTAPMATVKPGAHGRPTTTIAISAPPTTSPTPKSIGPGAGIKPIAYASP
jgi:hypothetical protein